MPDEKMLTDMGNYMGELAKAGLMVAAEGLHPSRKGARVHFSGPTRTVVDGPFTESKELIAGFSVLRVRSLEEAIEWVKRCPMPSELPPGVEPELEVRPIFTAEDFGEALTPELREQEDRMRARVAATE